MQQSIYELVTSFFLWNKDFFYLNGNIWYNKRVPSRLQNTIEPPLVQPTQKSGTLSAILEMISEMSINSL